MNSKNKKENMDTSQPGSSEENKPVFLPINAVVRIFSFLKRDDLDRCKRVNKMWRKLITNHNSNLPKRTIECLILTTDHEFRMTTIYEDKVDEYAVKKYFGELDIDGYEVNNKKKLPKPFITRRDFKFPCGDNLKVDIPKNYSFPAWDPFHLQFCTPGKHLIHKPGRRYGKKLFTQPMAFYEHLAFVLKNCHVKNIILHKFTFTELFVEKFIETLEGGLDVEILYMHYAKLRYISPATFHRFLNEAVRAERYVMEHMLFVLPNHINSELMRMPSIQKARSFFVGYCTSRVGGILTLNISPQAFLELASYNGREDENPPEREFFGVALSRITDDNSVLADFSKAYRRDFKKSYYKHVLLGGQRYVEGIVVNPNPNPRAQRQAPIQHMPQLI